jgi:hypothetical protein
MGNPLSAQKPSSLSVPVRIGDDPGGIAGDVKPPAYRPGRESVVHRAANLGLFPRSGNLFFPFGHEYFNGIPSQTLLSSL